MFFRRHHRRLWHTLWTSKRSSPAANSQKKQMKVFFFFLKSQPLPRIKIQTFHLTLEKYPETQMRDWWKKNDKMFVFFFSFYFVMFSLCFKILMPDKWYTKQHLIVYTHPTLIFYILFFKKIRIWMTNQPL